MKFQCDTCTMKFGSIGRLYIHNKSKKCKKIVKKNSKNTVDSQQMKKTIVDPHQKSSIKCEKCSNNFKTQEMLAKHLAQTFNYSFNVHILIAHGFFKNQTEILYQTIDVEKPCYVNLFQELSFYFV